MRRQLDADEPVSIGLFVTHLRHRPASILQSRSQFRHLSDHGI